MDPTKRFSDRVADYIKYRPGYPEALVDLLVREARLTPDSVVADVGSGTGILSQRFLEHGYAVIGVEPNDEMRRAAERLLNEFPRFTSVAGRAETTGLPDGAVHLVVAAQAFHWFDPDAARTEFTRILLENAPVAIIWNDRRTDSTPFLTQYEALLRKFCPEYDAVAGRHCNPDTLARFFAHAPMQEAVFDNTQPLDWEGLNGRLLSSSYVPASGPALERLLSGLRQAFDTHNDNGLVTFEYDTRVFYAPLT